MTNEIVLRTPGESEFARFIAPLSIAFNGLFATNQRPLNTTMF